MGYASHLWEQSFFLPVLLNLVYASTAWMAEWSNNHVPVGTSEETAQGQGRAEHNFCKSIIFKTVFEQRLTFRSKQRV